MSTSIRARKEEMLRRISELTEPIPEDEPEMYAEIALSRLWRGVNLAEANRYYETIADLDNLDVYGCGWDWILPHFQRAYLLFKDDPKMSSGAKSRLRLKMSPFSGTKPANVGTYRYFPPYVTENHDFLMVSGYYINNQILNKPNDWCSDWLSKYIDDRAKK